MLPPFDGLVAFDAALRRKSMTLAAADLGLTQSAISHRVRRLENFMGASLFYRYNGGLAPTPVGEALAEGLSDLLGELVGLRARCSAAAGADRLRVGVGAALAHYWLLRRLPGFAAGHPDVSVELEIVENEAPDQVAGLDVRILWVPADELRATSVQRPLFREEVFPVCAPQLLPEDFSPGDASVLGDLPLLHKGPAGRATSAEWSWAAWLERLGLPPRPRESFRFASIGPAMAAALEGAGAVLARTMLAHDALADGRLVRVLPPEQALPSSKAHVVRWSNRRQGDRRIDALVAWLCAKAAEIQPPT